jgi:hypothetical protein
MAINSPTHAMGFIASGILFLPTWSFQTMGKPMSKEERLMNRDLTETEQMLVELARRDERKKISRNIFIAGALAGGTMARKLSSDGEWRKWIAEEIDRRYPDAQPPAPEEGWKITWSRSTKYSAQSSIHHTEDCATIYPWGGEREPGH